MITISETPSGFELVSAHFRHTFANRNKAVLTAQLLAIRRSAETKQEVQILVPMGWGESVILSILDLRDRALRTPNGKVGLQAS